MKRKSCTLFAVIEVRQDSRVHQVRSQAAEVDEDRAILLNCYQFCFLSRGLPARRQPGSDCVAGRCPLRRSCQWGKRASTSFLRLESAVPGSRFRETTR